MRATNNPRLTAQQTRIACMFARGWSQNLIAAHLNMDPADVRREVNKVKGIYRGDTRAAVNRDQLRGHLIQDGTLTGGDPSDAIPGFEDVQHEDRWAVPVIYASDPSRARRRHSRSLKAEAPAPQVTVARPGEPVTLNIAVPGYAVKITLEPAA